MFWSKQTSCKNIKNPKNMPVKILQNSVLQSDERVIDTEVGDSESSTSNLKNCYSSAALTVID